MKRVPKCIRVRFLVAFAVWFTLLSLYIHRSNISVAILEMTDTEHGSEHVSQCIDNSTDTSLPDHTITPKPFNWDPDVTAIILGCYFYGYMATHFIGGIISTIIGPRITMAVCIAGSTIAMFISVPLAKVSPYGLVGARIVSGLFCGPLYPIAHEVIGNWSPGPERTLISVAANSGNMLGLIISFGIGGLITNSGVDGWQHFHYFSGGFGLLCLLIWILFVFDDPDSHPYISEEEKNYIKGLDEKTVNSDKQTGTRKVNHKLKRGLDKVKNIPFKEIFCSLPVYTLYLAHFGSYFILYSLLTGFPKYLSTVYGMPTIQASLLATIPFAVSFVVQLVWPIVVDFLRNKVNVSTTLIRKVSSVLGFVGCSVFLLTSTQFPCPRLDVNIVFIAISMGFWGFNTSSYFTSIIDMSPKYAGVLMGIINMFGSIAGFVNPELAQYFLDRYETKEAWKINFYIVGGIAVVSVIPYLIFGTSEKQSWADGRKKQSVSSPSKHAPASTSASASSE